MGPNSPQPRRLLGWEWQKERPGRHLGDLSYPYRFPGWLRPQTELWTLSNQERIGAPSRLPHPSPFSWAALGPQGGARRLCPLQRAWGLAPTYAAVRDAKLGAGAASRGVGGFAFFQSPLCPLHGARRIFTLESAPRHLPWANSAERQSRAAPPRPDIPGAMAEARAGWGRGATVDVDLAPGWAWSHPTQGGRGTRLLC